MEKIKRYSVGAQSKILMGSGVRGEGKNKVWHMGG